MGSDEPDSRERLKNLTYSLLEKEGFDCSGESNKSSVKHEKSSSDPRPSKSSKSNKTEETAKSKTTVKEEPSSSTFISGSAVEIEEELIDPEPAKQVHDSSCEIVEEVSKETV